MRLVTQTIAREKSKFSHLRARAWENNFRWLSTCKWFEFGFCARVLLVRCRLRLNFIHDFMQRRFYEISWLVMQLTKHSRLRRAISEMQFVDGDGIRWQTNRVISITFHHVTSHKFQWLQLKREIDFESRALGSRWNRRLYVSQFVYRCKTSGGWETATEIKVAAWMRT